MYSRVLSYNTILIQSVNYSIMLISECTLYNQIKTTAKQLYNLTNLRKCMGLITSSTTARAFN